jgi:hypothetical protein
MLLSGSMESSKHHVYGGVNRMFNDCARRRVISSGRVLLRRFGAGVLIGGRHCGALMPLRQLLVLW